MNRNESAALDRHITGNWGEDFFSGDFDGDEVELSPEEEAAYEAWEAEAEAQRREDQEDRLRAAAEEEGMSYEDYLAELEDRWEAHQEAMRR